MTPTLTAVALGLAAVLILAATAAAIAGHDPITWAAEYWRVARYRRQLAHYSNQIHLYATRQPVMPAHDRLDEAINSSVCHALLASATASEDEIDTVVFDSPDWRN